MSKVSAIIPAAGLGIRFGGSVSKQFYEINEGSTILEKTVTALSSYPFAEFIVGVRREDEEKLKEIAGKLSIPLIAAAGGQSRMDTVYNALIKATGEYAAIHDAVRPFVDAKVIKDTVDVGMSTGACICGLYVVDTVKQVVNGKVKATLARNEIFLAVTPQVFNRTCLIKAIEQAKKENLSFTDESSVYEYAGYEVSICLSTKDNIKITTQTDIFARSR